MRACYHILLKLILMWFIFADEKVGESCVIELSEDIQFTYPIPGRERVPDERGNCVISGKISWTEDATLLVERFDDFPHYLEQRKRGSSMRNLDYRVLSRLERLTMQGNDTEYFKFVFLPTDLMIFTLTYRTKKAREFECDTVLPEIPAATIAQCTQGRKFESYCLFLELAIQPKVINAMCREDSTGAPQWVIIRPTTQERPDVESPSVETDVNIRPDVESPSVQTDVNIRPDVESPSVQTDVNIRPDVESPSVQTDANIRPARVKGREKYSDPKILCDLSQCKNFPQTIEIVSCTDGINIGSNCTLQCKEGYVPAPHLYKDRRTFPIVQDGIPRFWAECSFQPREDIFPSWRPQVSTNGFRHLRNPDELYLDCMELETVIDLFTDPNSYYLDFLTAREFTSSPYDSLQIMNFLNENQEDDQTPMPEKTFKHDEEQDFRNFTTVKSIPDSILISLNEEEWRWVMQQMHFTTNCDRLLMKSLIRALFRRPPAMEPGKRDLDLARAVHDKLILNPCRREEVPDIPVNCNRYCSWDARRSRYQPCGSFNGATNIKNCIKCKYRLQQGCGRSNFLG